MNREECKVELITYLNSHHANGIVSYLKRNLPETYQCIFESTQFLPQTATILERIYNIINDIYSQHKCVCGVNNTRYITLQQGYKKFCSSQCSAKYTLTDRQKTCIEKYGVDNPAKNEAVLERRKKTTLIKYGTEHVLQNEAVKKKGRETIKNQYGCEHYTQTIKCTNQRKQTNMKRYGVSNPMQLPEFKEKQSISGYKKKIYTLPSGKEVSYQGYENRYFDILLETYNESQLKFHEDIPEFWYVDAGGISHRYYPDVYIPIDNLIIEIKSAYTATTDKMKNILKERSVKDAGYTYNIVVFDEECRGGKYKVFESFRDILVKNRILV